jgi:hypothetical protein
MSTRSGYQFSDDQRRWASRRRYGRSTAYWLAMIARQRGQCAWSKAPLRFDTASGTARKGGQGVHPIYAAVDHCSPGCDDLGHEIVSYDLNDLRGHLPPSCFRDLRKTLSWRRLMKLWRQQAIHDPANRGAFRDIRRSS